jgi:hypothetical protein
MTDARSRTSERRVRERHGTALGQGRRLLVAVIGALVVLVVGAISAAALVGLPIPTILTSDSNATSPTTNGNATSTL